MNTNDNDGGIPSPHCDSPEMPSSLMTLSLIAVGLEKLMVSSVKIGAYSGKFLYIFQLQKFFRKYVGRVLARAHKTQRHSIAVK